MAAAPGKAPFGQPGGTIRFLKVFWRDSFPSQNVCMAYHPLQVLLLLVQNGHPLRSIFYKGFYSYKWSRHTGKSRASRAKGYLSSTMSLISLQISSNHLESCGRKFLRFHNPQKSMIFPSLTVTLWGMYSGSFSGKYSYKCFHKILTSLNLSHTKKFSQHWTAERVWMQFQLLANKYCKKARYSNFFVTFNKTGRMLNARMLNALANLHVSYYLWLQHTYACDIRQVSLWHCTEWMFHLLFLPF